MASVTLVHGYEGFDFQPPATLEDVSNAFARWEAPGLALQRVRFRAELDFAIDRLREAVRRIEGFTDEQRSLSQAAQWLIDNFYVIEQIQTQLALQLTETAMRGLPAYRNGMRQRRARIELLAQFYLEACDFDFESDELIGVLADYQRRHALTLRELSLLAPVLDFLLIRQLTDCADRILEMHRAAHWADVVADARLRPLDTGLPVRAALEPQLVNESMVFGQAYLGQLGQRHRYDDPARGGEGESAADHDRGHAAAIEDDLLARTALDVRVRNIFRSVKAIELSDWPAIFARTSLVDRALQRNAVYGRMDAASRALYRREIEKLSLSSGMPEADLAELVLERFGHGSDDHGGAVDIDVGRALLADARPRLERELGVSRSPLRRLTDRWPLLRLWMYMSLAVLLTVGLTALALRAGLPRAGDGADWPAWWFGLLALWPASELALHIVNRASAWLFPPGRLPRLEFPDGIPVEFKTLVVVPTMLTQASSVEHQVRELERHYLSNRDDQLRFALLTDWCDADRENLATDDELLAAARQRIAALNLRYPLPAGAPEQRFYLFHRSRRWCEGEGAWMGWERKRGKLEELNRLLLGEPGTSFLFDGTEGPRWPQAIQYVITLDGDTRMPVGTVASLVGTAAHPLNRPQRNPRTGRVTHGYALFQPRISFLLPEAEERSVFRWIFSTGEGVDPYAGAVSDLYQDLFGEASYTGKGLYDLRAFHAAMASRVPDNTLLSHDLFESSFARCALVSDVAFFEDSPSHSEVAAARAHRWVRGDWQLLPWLLWLRREPLGPLNRWKMLDNLRRSLLPIACFLLIVSAWTLPAARPAAWLALVLATIALPGFLGWLAAWRRPTPKGGRTNRPIQLVRHFGHVVGQTLIELVLLAQNACVMADAIGRALWRTFASKRRMLEWRTAAQTKAAAGGQLYQFTWAINSATLPVLVSVAAVLAFHREAFLGAFPLIGAWWLAPIIAVGISSPRLLAHRVAHARELREFRRIAHRTWRFFARYVGAADHHLPPDNVQFEPEEVVAHRTSPTNIGLYLLTLVRAHEMGWLGSETFVARLRSTLASMQQMHKHEGHLLNWYDTRTLSPLEPRYVSSVDSGNLAAHLVVLVRSCSALHRRPVVSSDTLLGANDAWLEIDADWRAARGQETRGNVSPTEIDRALVAIGAALSAKPSTPGEYAACLQQAFEQAMQLKELVAAYAFEGGADALKRLLGDIEALADVLAGQLDDLQRACPWAGDPAFDALRREMPKLFQGSLQHLLDTVPTAGEVIDLLSVVDAALVLASHTELPDAPQDAALNEAVRACADARAAQKQWLDQLDACAREAEALWRGMNFGFLFDPKRKLFSIGYRVQEHQLDEGRYDLLASEARLGSYLACAKGDVPADHWFRLGRHMGLVPSGPVLISWSGSMFEYLMPALVMKMPAGSLLNQACRNAVAEQIRHGRAMGVPWGISESGINVRDVELTYQYGPSGVPTLSLKRGMDQQLVIAPYAAAMAAPFAPTAVFRNFGELDKLGALGPYGFYEAIDFTADRLGEGERCAIVRSHMAHHQAMSLLALSGLFCNESLAERFHGEPEMDAFDLLLQEQVPGSVVIARDTTVVRERSEKAARHATQRVRRAHGTDPKRPAVHLMSNGRYAMAITATGSGYSSCNGLDITRWREDRAIDEQGLFIYLRDADSGALWSATLAPTFIEPESYAVEFAEARVQFDQRHLDIRSSLEVVVAHQEDAEIRTLKLSNEGQESRRIEVAALCDVVLNPRMADLAHPAFQNLFITTEFDAARGALLATRRPRASHEPATTVMLGLVADAASGPLAYDTDRRVVVGRHRGKREPHAFTAQGALAGTTGAVLDPVLCLRQTVEIEPGGTARLSFVMAFGADREAVQRTWQRLGSFTALQREISRAWVYAQAKLHQLGIGSDEASGFQSLAAYLMFSEPSFRPGTEFMRGNQLSARAVWRYGISGDRPIVLITIDSNETLPLVQQMLRAHQFWRARSFAADIVIVNDRATSYSDDMQHQLEALVRHAGAGPDAPAGQGRVYVLRGDRLPDEERRLLMTICRVYLRGGQGLLLDQLRRRAPRPPLLQVDTPDPHASRADVELSGGIPDGATDTARLDFFNGLGGFIDEGREYRIVLPPGRATPTPWCNLIASPAIGTLVSESGSAFTWRLNARENQLSPWSNDALGDPSSELVYIQDRQSGAYWTPTAQPRRVPHAVYECAHGAGYTRFTTQVDDIDSELTHFVSWDKPLKFLRLRLSNTGGRRRTLSLTAFVNLCLGDNRSGKVDLLSTWASSGGTLYARNPSNADFGRDVAFLGCSHPVTGWTCDRTEFIGYGGTLAEPRAIDGMRPLRQSAGVGPDPAWALQTELKLEAGETQVLVFALGQAGSVHAADELLRMGLRSADSELEVVRQRWDDLLDRVQVSTPDRAMDMMLNRWLLYQVTSSRCLGRCGFYQAGGAYGFRDQLQDVMALVHAWPEYAREHILRAAAQQFVEGDVQHWWHPPSGKGVRTTFSDDRLFLPYAVAHYVSVTGDEGILDQEVPFLEGPILAPHEESQYFEPTISSERASLFDHCVRAIQVSRGRGVHGLPLMGCGDWNDGMNRVGWKGQGESVWMAWFLKGVLDAFMPLAMRRKSTTLVAEWTLLQQELLNAIEQNAWDGEWYRRAYFDDGTPLGSAQNDECRIDSLAQSWAVIAGGGDPARARLAMQRADEMLVDDEAKLIRLFTPSFDKTPNDPGYIKGYVPGIRENGGQYTHAAVWTVMAQARLGNAGRAAQLYRMLNPIGKSDSRVAVQKYRVEPYVMSADIYGEPPHAGRGGWTWYTGAAGWYYRVGLEEMLGIQVRDRVLHLKPCIPPDWPFYRVKMRIGTALYDVEVRNPDGRTGGVSSLTLDGRPIPVDEGIRLRDDGGTHGVIAVLGA